MKNIFHRKKREELQWYREHVDIRQYLERSGYVLEKSRNTKRYQAYFHEERGDKVYVPISDRYPVPSYYVNQFDQKDKGTLVDFIISREKKSLDEARLTLRTFHSGGEYIGSSATSNQVKVQKKVNEQILSDAEEQQRKHRLVMDRILREKGLKDESFLRSRFLEEDTIRARAFKGKVLLNEAPDGKFWAFPLREAAGNKVVGMALKNAEGERMLGKRGGLWISSATKNSRAAVEQLVLTEHPIDGMSYYQLHKKELQQLNTVFASTAGNPGHDQLNAVKEIISLHKIPKVILANDRDKAGAQYNATYQELIMELNQGKKENPVLVKVEVPLFKDFNAEIKAGKLLELRQLENSDISQPKHLTHLHPLREEVAKLIYDKQYPQLARKEVVKELQESFIEKEMDGVKVRFSIREVALINNQQKLLQLLEASAKTGQQHRSAPAKEEAKKQEPLRLKKEPEVQGEEAAARESSASDRPPLKRTAAIKLNAGDQQLEKAYFKMIKSLQGQIKGMQEYREQYQRLELYRKYPHLNEEEVDTYLGLMQRGSQGVHQQQAITRGKEKGLAGKGLTPED